MGKFKIEHNASKIELVQLKANIESNISQDIDLLADWSNNDRRYIVNELLRYALTQDEDFQRYKSERQAKHTPTSTIAKNVTAAAPIAAGRQ